MSTTNRCSLIADLDCTSLRNRKTTIRTKRRTEKESRQENSKRIQASKGQKSQPKPFGQDLWNLMPIRLDWTMTCHSNHEVLFCANRPPVCRPCASPAENVLDRLGRRGRNECCCRRIYAVRWRRRIIENQNSIPRRKVGVNAFTLMLLLQLPSLVSWLSGCRSVLVGCCL